MVHAPCFLLTQALGSMNMHVANSADSWLALVGSATGVLGPSKGHIPDLGAFRIAYMHLTPAHLWLCGAVTGLPSGIGYGNASSSAEKFNLSLDVSLNRLIRISGQPELDPEFDDSMHGFQLAKPVAVNIRQVDELVWPDAQHRVLHITGESSHFSFEIFANFIGAFGGKHAKTRFLQSLSVRD